MKTIEQVVESLYKKYGDSGIIFGISNRNLAAAPAPPQARCSCGWEGQLCQCFQEEADDQYQYMCPVCVWHPVMAIEQ